MSSQICLETLRQIFCDFHINKKNCNGQSYKAPTIVIYVSRVVNISNLLGSVALDW